MKKIIIGGLLLTLIGFVFLKINKQKPKIQVEPDCETKMVASNKVPEKFQGVPKSVDFSTFPEAKTYYTRITESVKKGPNFAGHFRLATWGCGTDCFGLVLVDTNSGMIVSYEPVNANYHLRATYDINSDYFILDPLYTGEERLFYQIEKSDGKEYKLNLACRETAKENYYLPTE